MKKAPTGHMREMRVEIHRGPANKVTGFTVHHHMMPKSVGKMGAFSEHETHSHPFSAKEHGAMMDHVADHLEGAMGHAAKAESDVGAVDDGRNEGD